MTDQNWQLIIDIPKTINDMGSNPKRIFNCYSFWLPYCIEIANKLGYSYSLALNASDWGTANFLSMTSHDIDNIIPDEYSMFESKALNRHNSFLAYDDFKYQWSQRKSVMFWRGSTTGLPIKSINSLNDLQRIKSCLIYRNRLGFDMKITNIVQNEIPKQIIRQWLISNRIFARKINEDTFKKYKYYPDLPGNNQSCGSWGAIKKYLRGNLVFKPNHLSKMYYDRFLEPWKHYVPINSDFMDLDEKFLWAQNNTDKACLISWRGSCVAKDYLSKIKDHFIKASIPKLVRV